MKEGEVPRGRNVFILIACLSVISTITTERYPWVGDEIDLVKAARSIAAGSGPCYYGGEEFPRMPALWHPPLYYYSLGAALRLFGETPRSCLLPGYISLILTWLGLFALTRRWSPRLPGGMMIPALLLALCPAAAATPWLVEVDSTWLVPAVLGLLVALELRSAMAIGVGFGLALLVKMTTPLVFPGALLVHRGVTGGLRRALRDTLVATLTGLLVFLALWGAWSHAAGLDFAEPFRHNFVRNIRGGAPVAPGVQVGDTRVQGASLQVLHRGWMAKNSVFWMTPGLLFLALLGTRPVLRGETGTLTDPSASHQRAHLVMLWGIMAGYWIIKSESAGFPKYHTPAFPLLVLPAALAVGGPDVLDRPRRLAASIFLLALVIGAFFPDPLEPLLQTDRRDVLTVLNAALVFFGVTVPLAVGLAFWAAPGSRMRTACLIHTLAWNTIQSSLLHDPGRSVLYHYGDRGITEAARRVQELDRPAGLALMTKELASLARIRFYDLRPALIKSPAFDDIVKNPEVTLLGYRVRGVEDLEKYPEKAALLSEHFVLDGRIGSYALFRRRVGPRSGSGLPGNVRR